MHSHSESAEETLEKWSRSSALATTVGSRLYEDESGNGDRVSPVQAVFRRVGECWIVIYEGTLTALKDAVGLHHIGFLLRREGWASAATELLAATDGRPGDLFDGAVDPEDDRLSIVADLGDAGAALDDQAANEYARRLRELRGELADVRHEVREATRLNDLGRQAVLREKIETALQESGFLVWQLAEGGKFRRGRGAVTRGHRVASHQERARLLVTKNIKAAVDKIRRYHPALADHFTARIKKGYACVYVPDPKQTVHWQL